MKKILTSITVTLLLLAAAVTAIAWLLPTKVSIAILMFIQLLMLVILGESIKQKQDHGTEA